MGSSNLEQGGPDTRVLPGDVLYTGDHPLGRKRAGHVHSALAVASEPVALGVDALDGELEPVSLTHPAL